ncbi:MAG: hypothetical protein ACLGRW_12080 [Acidobacteriota bacterium]
MAVYLCGIDETSGRTQRDKFLMSGFLAPECEWTDNISPSWERRVLAGPPRIPYLHMTDMRSPKWREEYGLSRVDADARIDAAIDVIDEAKTLVPIGIEVNGGKVRDNLSGMRVVHPKNGNAALGPDYLCFMAYSYLALKHVAESYPDAKKVDFLVERNGRTTAFIQEFHRGLGRCFEVMERPDLAKLLGKLLPASKERIPVQAADVLCWHTARPKETMDELDLRRWEKLSTKIGFRSTLSGEFIRELAVILSEPENSEDV